MNNELLESILNALPYEIVFCDRNHTIQYLNKVAKQHYGERIHIGDSIDLDGVSSEYGAKFLKYNNYSDWEKFLNDIN